MGNYITVGHQPVVEEKDKGVQPHSSTTTPSGVEIVYYPPPDRHYTLNGTRVPSVTDILDVLDKKGLIWWGMEVGAEQTGRLAAEGYAVARMSKDELVTALNRTKRTTNHVRNRAGDRGKAVHDALDTWAKTGTIPSPSMFPEEESGYVEGLVQFLNDVRPSPVASEVMVASLEEGFAGRYDLRVEIDQPVQVVHHITPKKTYRSTLRPGVLLVDLKTSAGVYPSHHLQIEAYEGASIESGYDATSARGILHVTPEGRYEFVRSRATYRGFLMVKEVHAELTRIKKKGRK